jgi:hypothetical protein
MTTVATERAASGVNVRQVASWFLIAQIVLWVPAVAIVIAVPDLPLEPSASWTAQTQAHTQAAWIGQQISLVVAFLTGIAAVAAVAGSAGLARRSRLALVCRLTAASAAVLAVVFAALRLGMLATTAPRLDDVTAFTWSVAVAYALDALALVSTAACALVLRRTGMARRTGLVIAVVSVLLIPLGLLKPPFTYGILWLVLGVALVRRRTEVS